MRNFEIFSPLPRKTSASIIEEGRNSRIKQAITVGLVLQHIISTSEPDDQITQKCSEFIESQESAISLDRDGKKLLTQVMSLLKTSHNLSTPNDFGSITPDQKTQLETIENPSRKTAILGALFNQWPEEMHAQVEEVKQHFNPKTKN